MYLSITHGILAVDIEILLQVLATHAGRRHLEQVKVSQYTGYLTMRLARATHYNNDSYT